MIIEKAYAKLNLTLSVLGKRNDGFHELETIMVPVVDLYDELTFEEKNIEEFVEKLEKLYPSIQYVNRLMEHSWGQKVIRFYDLDGNLIEVGTPM